MGTRGYRVYRYRDMYFITYNKRDSYPSGLGVDMLDSYRYPSSIRWKRQELGEILDELDGQSPPEEEDDDFGTKISKQRPRNDFFIEWIYEIDLDRNIFHINGIPFFNLECLPNSDSFLEYISEDHYGNTTCPPTCPPKQRYKRPAPPVVDDSDIATYQSLVCTGTEVALSDLLAISDALSPDEHVRVSLLETMIGQCMAKEGAVNAIHELELISGPWQITNTFWLVASSMADIAFVPQIFHSGVIFHPDLNLETTSDAYKPPCHVLSMKSWRRKIVLAITLEWRSPFSIVQSLKWPKMNTRLHSAIRLPWNFYRHSMPILHLCQALLLLPVLGIDPELFVRATQIFRRPKTGENKERTDDETLAHGAGDTLPNANCAVLPPELWRKVALDLELPDLLTFGLVSGSCREVA
ncbi:hypothetical protein K503DRAFT_220312 [Rhizopogon vinicolor AM-OR11-026]|uniref:F-box domain-containing protein n=1 Tax=Rhizopogon vinicolor AM-OR11-026 TaxID=1314800 RepID=A0A1B7MYK4_9AGAM|nr:hypothetical protein K503DRAFT_220312 [Rhizopogon vinicolor AM-OR11-026]